MREKEKSKNSIYGLPELNKILLNGYSKFHQDL